MAQALGVMDVLIAGQVTVDWLAQQIGQGKRGVLAAARVAQMLFDELSQAEPFVQLPHQNQATVGGERRSLGIDLRSGVEGKLKRRILFLTPWVWPSRRG